MEELIVLPVTISVVFSLIPIEVRLIAHPRSVQVLPYEVQSSSPFRLLRPFYDYSYVLYSQIFL